MEKQIIFRDRQEVQSGDLSSIGSFAARSLDSVVKHGLSSGRRYTAFGASKTSSTEVTLAPGRLWDRGQVHFRDSQTVFDFLGDLPLATFKMVTICAYANSVDTEVQPRDFLIDVDTGQTEPEAVPMESWRMAELTKLVGEESAQPQRPSVPAGYLAVCWIRLDTQGVKTITMNPWGLLPSSQRNHNRLNDFDDWRDDISGVIDTLLSSLVNINDKVSGFGTADVVDQIAADVALIKEELEFDSAASDYGADRYLTAAGSNTDHINYLAKLQEGVRFADDNADESILALFNPIDDRVIVNDGFCLPDYVERFRHRVQRRDSELAISQYQFQNVDYRRKTRTRRRIRYGESFVVCNNNRHWRVTKDDWRKGTFERNGETFEIIDVWHTGKLNKDGSKHGLVRLRKVWTDIWKEHYWDAIIENGTVSGSMIAQTFPQPDEGWLTGIDLRFTQIGPSGNVTLVLCETDGGAPDMQNTIATVTLNQADMLLDFPVGSDEGDPQWTTVPFPPTFLSAGKRYAICVLTPGNHFVGMTDGENYPEGTFFYSTDGEFFTGDLAKDLCFRTRFARFRRARVAVEMDALSLSGGISDIDILAETILPDGADIKFQIQPSGSTTWMPIDRINPTDGRSRLYGLPALVKLRAIFIGTADAMPGIGFTNSRVIVSRPRTNFLHISEPIDLVNATQSLKVIVTLNEFKESIHDLTATIDDKTNNDNAIAPASVTDLVLETLGGGHKRIRRTFEWTALEIPVALDQFVINLTGTTTSALDVFVVEERVHLGF